MLIVEQGLGHNMREKMATTGTDALFSALEALHGNSWVFLVEGLWAALSPRAVSKTAPCPR